LRNSLDLAQHAEAWGYNRFWLAEHHNMPGIASAATSIVIGHVAGGTKTIRVGSGGIMLPNHSPLVIAEQFGTLASLYPDRIDLGLGRAPGTDQPTMRALRRNVSSTSDNFPQDVEELQSYFEPAAPNQKIRAVPGAGLRVPIWLLGSSLFSAQLAAELGLPFAFASHFAPADMMQALQLYRAQFKPSRQLDRPYTMLGLNAIVAETDEEAFRLSAGGMMGRMMNEYLLPLLGAFGFLEYLKHAPDVPDSDVTAEYCARHNWVVGSPSTVVEKLERVYDEVGGFGQILVFGFDYAENPEAWHTSLGMLATEVFPLVAHLVPREPALATA